MTALLNVKAQAGSPAHDPAAGVRNLLDNCVGVKAGDTVLIVREPRGEGQYEEGIADFIAEEVRAVGAEAHVIEAPISSGPDTFPKTVLAAMQAVDHTIFFSRIGDQLRFRALPGPGSKTMTYTLDFAHLGDDFARIPFAFLEEIQRRVVARISRARRYSIECARGTSLTMALDNRVPSIKRPEASPIRQFTLKNFPVMIFPPMVTRGLTGRLVLTQALTSTAINGYDDSVLRLTSPLTLDVRSGRIESFEGNPDLVARVERHFDRVGGIVGGDPRAIHSWHTGINPATFFSSPALFDIGRWGSVAFGSPRYTHFHMCGNDPGDICGQLFDATITFDDEVLWDRGHFAFLDRPDSRALMAQYRLPPPLFAKRRELGIEG